jgi:cytosine/adenosine deaminase-related metal-dependent hydrolase
MNSKIHVLRNVTTIVAYDAKTGTHVYLRDGDVAFDETGFVHVGGRYEGEFGAETSGRNRMVMPGLVNIHCHSGEEPIAKGIFDDIGTAALWGNALYEYSSLIEISDEALQASLTVMLGDLMRSGVTTLVDIAGPHDDWLPTLAASGARAYAAPGFREAEWHVENSHRLDLRWDAGRGRDAFQRALATVDAACAHPSARLGGIVSPSQVETCSAELLQDAAQAAADRGVPITIHAAQTMAEHEELLRRTGKTAVQYLEALGVLRDNLVIGHCIFIDSHSWTRQRSECDIALLAHRGATVAHCPVTFSRSGMVLESIGRYRRAGVHVGLGTDSYPFNMLEEMRQALICARIAGKTVFDINTADVLDMATLAGARALGRTDIGRIAVGARADFSIVDLSHPAMQPVYDPLRNLLHCAAERAVESVYVDGSCIAKGGKPRNLDYDAAVEVLDDAQKFATARIVANDPRGRSLSELAPLSLSRTDATAR